MSQVLAHRGRQAATPLVLVGLGYAVLQLLFSARVGLGWDETVYVSQVARRIPAAYLSAPRARGTSVLVWPVASWTSSTTALRLYLTALSSAGLVAAWSPWLRLRAAPVVALAAALFAVLWPTIFYGPEAMPNLYVALAAVAAVGHLVRCRREGPSRRRLLALAGAVALAAMVRPSDAAWLGLPLGAVVVLVPSWRSLRAALALAVGFLVGLLPWLVESFVSYGGPLARLHRATAVEGGTSLHGNVVTLLRSVDGPLLCRPCTRPVPAGGVLLWAGGALAVAVGLVVARRRGLLGEEAVVVAAGTAVAVPYLLLLGYGAPRFLLPAYALLALPAASALVALASRGPAGRVCTGGLLVGLLVAQLAVLVPVAARNTRERHGWAVLAGVLHHRGEAAPCVVSGEQAPPVAYYAGCSSRQVRGHDASISRQALLALSRSAPVALVYAGPHRRPSWAATWRLLRVTTPTTTWTVYLSPRPS